MAYHFFTEPTKLTPQVSNDAFGALNNDAYRICNLLTGSSSTKAFAVCNGEILVQESYGNPDLVNLVIKPSEQPNLDLPKIEYIIYKGITKNSIIQNDGIIASSSKNDLTRKIWESYTLQLAAFSENPDIVLPGNPMASDILGFAYSNTGIEGNKMFDSDPLNKAFYNASKTLFSVLGGDYIGDFSSSEIGIMIAFEKVGLSHQFKLAREHDSKVIFAPLTTTATNADKFKRKHEKEVILGYIDSCAFFSAFYNAGIKVYTSSGFEKIATNALYENVIIKHYNKQKIYLDIRNEYEDSISYYENYSNNISLKLNNSNYTTINYYRTGWPILVLDHSEVSSENLSKSIRIKLPIRDKRIPTIYLKRAYIKEIGLDVLPQGVWKFPVMSEDNISNNEIELSSTVALQKVDNTIISDYLNIKYFSSIAERVQDVDTQQLIYKRYYLDNLFPIFDMATPFSQNVGKSTFKLFYDTGYSDKLLINTASYSHHIGIGHDNNFMTFISLPSIYNFNVRNNADDVIPLGGLEAVSDKPFLLQVVDLVKVVKLIKGKFLINGAEKEFLKFAINEDAATSGEIASNYTFEDVTVFALTNQQFSNIKLIKEQEFTDQYKVYIGITNVQVGIDDTGTSYTKFNYVLNGIKADEGEIISHNVLIGIEIYTDKKIVGVSYQRNYEEKVGFDHFYDPVNKVTYEDYFIAKNTSIKSVVDTFIKSLNGVNNSLPSTYARIRSIVKRYASSLWTTGKNQVQSNPNNPDDRPLYWARIKMLVGLKSHLYFRSDIIDISNSSGSTVIVSSELEEMIALFEECSRNYSGINFSAAGSKKKILITGFDPFSINKFKYPGQANINQSNPSGCVALALHGLSTANNLGYIQTMIVPVRYTDFDHSTSNTEGKGEGIIEDNLGQFIHEVDMIITISQSLPGDYNIDRYATVTRGGFRDNLDFTRLPLTKSIDVDSSLEWIETTLPDTFIQLPVKYNWKYSNSNGVVIENPNGSNPPTSGIRMNAGPGGNYLSNEIFYRVARLRKLGNPTLKTGHFHISMLQGVNDDFSGVNTQTLIDIVKNAVNNGVTGV